MVNTILSRLKESLGGEGKGDSLLGASTATQQENQQCKSRMESDQPCSKPLEEYHELNMVNSIVSPFVKAQWSSSSMRKLL